MLLYPNAHNAKLLILNYIRTLPNYQVFIDQIRTGIRSGLGGTGQ